MEEVFLRLSQGESAAADSAPPPSAASLQPLRAVGQPPGKPAPLPAAALSPAAEEAPQPDVASPRRRSAARPSSSSLSAAALLPPSSPGGGSSRRSDLSSGGQREASASAPAGQPASASVGARRSGAASPCKQLCVLLQKRAVCAKRDRKGLFLQHALPVLLPRHVADTSQTRRRHVDSLLPAAGPLPQLPLPASKVLLVALTMLVLLIPDPRVGPRRLLDASLSTRLEKRLGECLGSV